MNTKSIIIDDDFLLPEQKKLIEDLFDNESIPFYLANQSTAIDDGNYHFIHRLLNNTNNNKSYLFDPLINILEIFLKKHNIKINKVIRAAINVTFNNGNDNCGEHIDHEFYHKQLLVYLNDSEGDTVILNTNGCKEIIKPKKYRGICFENNQHYHYYPKTGVRKVMVFTFN